MLKIKKYFIASLCKNGILGGGIVADPEAITYYTKKLTVPDQYKQIKMKYTDIHTFTIGHLFLFPTVSLTMKSGEEYKFIIFARKRLVKILKEFLP